MNNKSLLPLLLFVLLQCSGCVYRLCGYHVNEVEHCGETHSPGACSKKKSIKVIGTIVFKKRSFIFDETVNIKDGMFLVEAFKRFPVYLLTMPLQLMIYEDESDIPMDALIDIDLGVWGNVRTYRLDRDYHRERRENAYERKVCDVAMHDGRNATFLVRYREGFGSVGDLYLRIVEKDGTMSEKRIYEFISIWLGWLVVDDSGTVVYIKDQNFGHTCELAFLTSERRDCASTVAYRLNWQSGKFEPVVELGYGELVRCSDVQ